MRKNPAGAFAVAHACLDEVGRPRWRPSVLHTCACPHCLGGPATGISFGQTTDGAHPTGRREGASASSPFYFEKLAATLGAFVVPAAIQLALRRLAWAWVMHTAMMEVHKGHSKPTFINAVLNAEIAPVPDLPAIASERGGAIQSRHRIRIRTHYCHSASTQRGASAFIRG